jgi:hypothetical protein
MMLLWAPPRSNAAMMPGTSAAVAAAVLAALISAAGSHRVPASAASHGWAPPSMAAAAQHLVDALLDGPHFIRGGRGVAPWRGVGYWQEANLDETFANYLLAPQGARGLPTASMVGNRTEAQRREEVVAAMQRSFFTYTAESLISGAAYSASNTSYDDLLWFALAYLRAHELCVTQPETFPCSVPLPEPVQQPCTCIPCGSASPHNYSGPGSHCSHATTMCNAGVKSAGTCYTLCATSCDCTALTCVVEMPSQSTTTLLSQGKKIFDFMYNHSWNEDYCEGGFAWAFKAQNYKNCVTNQQGVLVAAKLARLLGTEVVCDCKAGMSYAKIALHTSSWLFSAPMRNATNGLYNDGLRGPDLGHPNTLPCQNDNGTLWSCACLPLRISLMPRNSSTELCLNSGPTNSTVSQLTFSCGATHTDALNLIVDCQGLPLGIAVELHRLRGEQHYLDDALAISAAIQTTLVSPGRWPVATIADTAAAAVTAGVSTTGEAQAGPVLYEIGCATDPMCEWIYPPLPLPPWSNEPACKCDNNAMIFKGIVSRYLGYLRSYLAELSVIKVSGTTTTVPVRSSMSEQQQEQGRLALVRRNIDSFLHNNSRSVLANNQAARNGDYGLFWQGPVFGAIEFNSANLNQAVLDLFTTVISA